MAVNDFAVIGLNNTGKSFASNMQGKQYSVAVYDADFETASDFSDKGYSKIKAYRDLKSLITSLNVPRKIFLSAEAEETDAIIEEMTPHLGKADTFIDLSESSIEQVKKRGAQLEFKSIRYLEAAVFGPHDELSSGAGLIIGGSEEAFSSCSRILRLLSKEHKGFSSCVHSGEWGTGSYTRIVHDGIEAALMQIIADGYYMLRSLAGMKCGEISSAFAFINEELYLYLLKITADILEQTDEDSGTPIIDFIMDSASSDPTAGLMLEQSYNNGIPSLLSAQAQFLRLLSAQKEQRRACAKKLYAADIRYDGGGIKLLDCVKDALKASMIIAYAQGFDLLRSDFGGGEWNYGNDEIARVWCGASTIKSDYLTRAQAVYNSSDHLLNLMNDNFFANQLKSYQRGFRETVMLAAKHGCPAPSFMSALGYYDSMRAESLPANLIQSQLNYMRKDTVRRYDIQGNFNVDWVVEDKKKDPR